MPSNLEQLLQRPRAPWRSAEGLLACLSAAVSAPEAARSAFVAALQASEEVAWEPLRGWVANWPSVPESTDALSAWLADTESLGLALLGSQALAGVGQSMLVGQIQVTLSAAKEQIAAREDQVFFAGKAARRIEELHLDVAPWTWFSPGGMEAFLASSEDPAQLAGVACEHWFDGELHMTDSDALLVRVQVEGVVRDAYRAAVQARMETLWVTQWNAAWSLDVLRTAFAEEDLRSASPLVELWLPHIHGPIEVFQHEEGLLCTYGPNDLVCLAEDIDVTWGDATLGTMTTHIKVSSPSAAEDVWHGLGSLRRVARGEGHERGAAIVQALTADLASGVMAKVVAAAHRAFEDGSDLSDEELRLLNHAFEVRMVMSDALSALSGADVDVGELAQAIEGADEVHAGHASATFLVDDVLHDDLTGDLIGAPVPIDVTCWWGSRVVLDHKVPSAVVDRALGEIADERAAEKLGDAPLATVTSIFAKRDAPKSGVHERNEEYTRLAASDRASSGAAECTWLSDEGPSVGCAPVMLVGVAEAFDKLGVDKLGVDKRGVRAELRVVVGERPSSAALWRDASLLERTAKATIRDAWLAAGRECGAAPFAFEQHRLEFVVEGVSFGEVDGGSLGLSAALAFASAWSEMPIKRGLVPMVALEGLRLAGVFEVTAKANAAALDGAQFLVTPANEAEVRAAGHTAVVVTTLKEALGEAGLSLDGVAHGGGRNALKQALQGIQNAVAIQSLGDGITWRSLADEGARLLTLLAAGFDESDAASAHAVALAYCHAGLPGWAKEWVEKSESTAVDHQAMDAVVQVNALIDSPNTDESEDAKRRLADLYDELPAEHELRGRIAGTLGRAHMHARDLEEALVWLSSALDAHRASTPYETPRSRHYLAMALRMDQRAADALDELVQAKRELVELTRPESPELERSTELFVNYELARTLLALDRPEEALRFADDALAECRPGEFWPRLGVMRARAWALRVCERGEEADAVVDEMREVFGLVPQEHHGLAEALIEEARGYPCVEDGEGGEVY